MSSTINTGSFSKALMPGVNAWYGDAYKEYPVEYTALFDTYSSRKAFEEDMGVSGLGLAQTFGEGQSINYDTMTQGFLTRYTHVKYGLGFMITREMVDDDQYDVVGRQRARALAYSMRQTKETVGANVYNRAFNSSYVGGDGVSMINTAHPNVMGGTQSNRPATDINVSEAALEQAFIDIQRFKNDRGLLIQVIPQSLIIPPELEFEVKRILQSDGRVGTANNDANILKGMGLFPKGVAVNHYLSSATAWFIRTNTPDGMKYFERMADTFAEDNDFDSDVAKFKAQGRYSFGWTDWRSVYGTPGV